MKRTQVVCLAAILVAGAVQAHPWIGKATTPPARCLNYDDSAVTLSGTVFDRIYYGPPNYGEDPATDSREQAFLLLLDAPVCVTASSDPEQDNNAFEGNQIVIQLAAVHVDFDVVKKVLGKRATIRGNLFHALTGHHKTPVVLDIYNVSVP